MCRSANGVTVSQHKSELAPRLAMIERIAAMQKLATKYRIASDPIFGEQVKAVLVLRPDARAAPEEIQDFCKKYLADYKVPRYVEFREALPRNPAGKVVKGGLTWN